MLETIVSTSLTGIYHMPKDDPITDRVLAGGIFDEERTSCLRFLSALFSVTWWSIQIGKGLEVRSKLAWSNWKSRKIIFRMKSSSLIPFMRVTLWMKHRRF